jgi:hypothetical protein
MAQTSERHNVACLSPHRAEIVSPKITVRRARSPFSYMNNKASPRLARFSLGLHLGARWYLRALTAGHDRFELKRTVMRGMLTENSFLCALADAASFPVG